MSILLDLILIAIIGLFTFIGFKQGLVKSVIKILSFFIAIIISFILYVPISNAIIDNTNIDENIKEAMVQKILPENTEANEETQIDIQDSLTQKLIGNANNTVSEVAQAFTVKLIRIAVLLILFIVIKIVLRLVLALTSIIDKIPGLKQINKAGGIIYGFIKGIIIVFTILGVIYLASPLIGEEFINTINKTVITNIMYNNNILLNIIL